MPFEFRELEIPGMFLISSRIFPDERGFFRETFAAEAFRAAGLPHRFVQDNHSRSARNVLRGLHYQLAPKAQGKLVLVTEGEIFDVGADLRPSSRTYGKWAGVRLSGQGGEVLYLPPGLAHGFVVLSESADVCYKVTADYAPKLDRGIRWDDPVLGIRWPVKNPVLSAKDAALPPLSEAENNY